MEEKIAKLDVMPPSQTHAMCWSEPSTIRVAMKVNEIIDVLNGEEEDESYHPPANREEQLKERLEGERRRLSLEKN